MDLNWNYASGIPSGEGAPPPPAARSIRRGDIIDQRFRVERVLETGALSFVFLAQDLRSTDLVALKVSQKQLDEETAGRQHREAELLGRLDHPGVVELVAAGVWQGRGYLAVDLVPDGKTLQRHLDQGLPVQAGIAVVLQVAEALGHAHERGVVHRDLKPANVLVDAEGQARVIDFDLGRYVGAPRMTRSGQLIGTPRTMAPEQLRGEEAGPAADVWALGVLLYRVLTERFPFEGNGLTDLAKRIEAARPAKPSEVVSGISPELDALCLRALSRDPTDRFPNASAFAADLKRAMGAAWVGTTSIAQWLLESTRGGLESSLILGPGLVSADPVLFRLEGYELLGEIARGGFGTVFRARDGTGRDVAIKFLSAKLSERRRERFLREGQVAASIDHPGVVRIHACGETEGIPFLVYELVEGSQTLRHVFERDVEPIQRVALVREVAEALAHVHEKGIIHRDIKPANVLIDSGGRPRITDFGLAVAPQESRLTLTGELVGSPAYMAPEQFSGNVGAASTATDVWALGVLLYEALTGTLPFFDTSIVLLALKVNRGELDPPSKIARVSPALEAVCLTALRPDPAERYPDAGVFAAALDAALAQSDASFRLRRGGIAAAVVILLSLIFAWVLWPKARELPPVVDPPPVAPTLDESAVAEAEALLAKGRPVAALEALGTAIGDRAAVARATACLAELRFDDMRAALNGVAPTQETRQLEAHSALLAGRLSEGSPHADSRAVSLAHKIKDLQNAAAQLKIDVLTARLERFGSVLRDTERIVDSAERDLPTLGAAGLGFANAVQRLAEHAARLGYNKAIDMQQVDRLLERGTRLYEPGRTRLTFKRAWMAFVQKGEASARVAELIPRESVARLGPTYAVVCEALDAATSADPWARRGAAERFLQQDFGESWDGEAKDSTTHLLRLRVVVLTVLMTECGKRANAALRAGDSAEAQRELALADGYAKRADAIETNELNTKQASLLLLRHGVHHLLRGDVEGARALLVLFRQGQEGNNPDAALLHAEILMVEGNLDAAAEALTHVFPVPSEVFVAQGHIALLRGAPNLADVRFEEARQNKIHARIYWHAVDRIDGLIAGEWWPGQDR